MTQINTKIIADSKNEFGNRITTMVVTFPRFILAELNTHRMFSRNSASSRAIPFEKMVKSVEENPFIPIAWQKDHKGMQGTEYITDLVEIENCKALWLVGRNHATEDAMRLNSVSNITKQLCNRIIEPFMWHTVIITATEWENFFALRCPKYIFNTGDEEEDEEFTFRSRKDVIKRFGEEEVVEYETGNVALKDLTDLQWLKLNYGQAEIHIMTLAEAMWDAYNESTPRELKAGEWHIPFGDQLDVEQLASIAHGKLTKHKRDYAPDVHSLNPEIQSIAVKIATAMCARISYTVVGEEGKEPNYENDIKLHDNLAKSGHWSPFEHCARSFTFLEEKVHNKSGWSGNFRGFIQYRKMFSNENKF